MIQEIFKDSSFILDEKESHHIISVLRLREGSNITLTDGRGNIYYGLIEIVGKKSVKGKILSIENSQKINIIMFTLVYR